jgi:hypothetical protein
MGRRTKEYPVSWTKVNGEKSYTKAFWFVHDGKFAELLIQKDWGPNKNHGWSLHLLIFMPGHTYAQYTPPIYYNKYLKDCKAFGDQMVEAISNHTYYGILKP